MGDYRQKIRIVFVFIFFTGIFMIPRESYAQYSKFKALYIYNFIKRIDWPSDVKETTFNIGVYGDSDIISELETLVKTKKVVDQKIKIVKYTDLKDIKYCHLLLLSKQKSKDVEKILQKFISEPMLIISERKNNYADIYFIEDNYTLTFGINEEYIHSKGMKVQKSLINLGENNKGGNS